MNDEKPCCSCNSNESNTIEKDTKQEKLEVSTPLIPFDHFSKITLKAGQILEASPVEKSKKLLRLAVDLGEVSGARQIVAGIAQAYNPQDLIGRKVVVVTNLEPAKLMGVESHGMLLAATDTVTGKLELLSPGIDTSPGSRVS